MFPGRRLGMVIRTEAGAQFYFRGYMVTEVRFVIDSLRRCYETGLFSYGDGASGLHHVGSTPANGTA